MDDEEELDAMIAARGGPANVVDIVRRVKQAPDALQIFTPAQLRARAQSVEWLVKGVIPADSVGIFFGASGAFKSFIALDLALHVAHGLKWLGRKTRRGPVVIIAAEGGAGISWRIDAWHKQHALICDDASIHIIPVSVDLLHDAARVCEAAASVGVVPALLIVDTMAQTFQGEENSATEVSTYLRELGLWFRESWRCSVLIVHHTGHVATERPRGSSALRSNVDWMYGCFRDEKEMLATLECVKQKDSDPIESAVFSLDHVQLGTDSDGDPISSLVAHQLGAPQQIAAALIYEGKRGRGGNNNLFLELAMNGMEEKKLRTVYLEAIDGDAEKKRKAYFRARKWAVEAKIVEIIDGYILRSGE